MLYRLLGKLFFLFWICPWIADTAKFVLRYSTHKANQALDKQIREERRQRQQSRRDHPAGSRLPQE